MYTLINKAGNVQRITDKESKRDELLRMGYRLAEDKPASKKSKSAANKSEE